MSTPVNVIRHRASDGTLHDSITAAARHEAHEAERVRIDAIVGIIEKKLGYVLSDVIPDWDEKDWWDRTEILQRIANVFDDHCDEVAAVIATQKID